ncbi:MAG: lysophospholipase, partial [Thermoproteota archaeon]|nr:lysophospholipase [Thermoproteota archaeon]
IWPSSLEATPTWIQISENDLIIPPEAERQFAKRMNATTVSINSSHASLVSHHNQVAQLILNATKGSTK